MKGARVSQEFIVFSLTIALIIVFSVARDTFLSTGNLLALLRNISVLGILSLGMAIAVIGRGIDLVMVATMVVAVSWAFVMAGSGLPLSLALIYGGIFVFIVGCITGVIIAFGEVPAIFATLAMGSVVYGFGRTFFIKLDMQNMPAGYPWFRFLGQGEVFGIPFPIIVFACLSALMHVLLRYTRFGWFIYALGDNPASARTEGLPVRPLIVAQYMVSSLIAYLAGLVMASSSSGMNARLYNSTLIYDVVLVVVIGGISLNGGHGRVRNVLVGALLVGVLSNGMTIMNVNYTVQNLAKSIILLVAIVIDGILNPRDEQTGRQGDDI